MFIAYLGSHQTLFILRKTFEYNLDTGLASRDVSVTFDPTQRGCGGLTDV